MNETAAKEWLTKSWHHLSTASLLFKANHYSDIIAVEIHYSCEITLKSMLAHKNKRIMKTHDLLDIYKLMMSEINFEDADIDLLDIISNYHIAEAYPIPNKSLPSGDEIKLTLNFAHSLFEQVCAVLNINPEEVKK